MMPIYLLGTRTASIEILGQPMSVSISGAVGDAQLYVDTAPGQRFVQANPHLVVIPTVTAELTVRVRPVSGPTFGHDTVVHLAIGDDSANEVDPVQINFDPVDASGCSTIDLATITPIGDRIQVAVRAVADTPLSPLSSLARTAARRSAGRHGQAGRGPAVIAVDTSASMMESFYNGSVAAAVDLVIGVADVVGIKDVSVSLVGEECTPVAAPPAELAQAVARAPVRWSVGARWSRLPAVGHTVVVTDTVSSRLRPALPVIYLSANTRLREAGALLPPPPGGVGAEQQLRTNPGLVGEIAAALLRLLT